MKASKGDVKRIFAFVWHMLPKELWVVLGGVGSFAAMCFLFEVCPSPRAKWSHQRLAETIRQDSLVLLDQVRGLQESSQELTEVVRHAGVLFREYNSACSNAKSALHDLQSAEQELAAAKRAYRSLPQGTVVRRKLGAAEYTHPTLQALDSAEDKAWRRKKEHQQHVGNISQLHAAIQEFLDNRRLDGIEDPSVRKNLSIFHQQCSLYTRTDLMFTVMAICKLAFMLIFFSTGVFCFSLLEDKSEGKKRGKRRR